MASSPILVAKASGLIAFSRLAARLRHPLAVCIILAPLSVTVYRVAWMGTGRAPRVTAALAGDTRNTLRPIGAVAASFFPPPGYAAMSLPGMPRMPGHATNCAALVDRLDPVGRADRPRRPGGHD
jgi:hypothetical protein